MNLQKRRDFLKLCIGSVPALAFAHGLEVLGKPIPQENSVPFGKATSVERFVDRLPIPKILKPENTTAVEPLYRVVMTEGTQQLHSQLPPTRIWGYEGQYPGPTIEAKRDRPIVIEWENRLPAQHMFAIDRHIQGVGGAIRATPHLHGGCVPSESDGLPEQWIAPGQTVRYRYPNRQSAATLWYHDRAAGIARLNVYAGLSGLFLLRDDEEGKADLASGEYEIPLILRDCTLDGHGQLLYATTFDDGQTPPPGTWAPECLGDLPLVNGALYPYLEVEPRPYRLRVVNAANQRFFELFINLARNPIDVPSLVDFQQIGGDGGSLPVPATLHKLMLAPGERADLIVDFSAYAGKCLILSNDAPAPFPSWGLVHPHHLTLYQLMQFRVTLPRSAVRAVVIPKGAWNSTRSNETTAAVSRDFILSEAMDQAGRSLGIRINGKGYSDAVMESVKLGTTEKWRFINDTEYAHPIYLDMAQFRIVERQGYSVVALRNGSIELVGTPRHAVPSEQGWKDTAVVDPREVLTLLVKFEGYAGRFAFGSQILEHSDKSLMRPYEVLPA